MPAGNYDAICTVSCAGDVGVLSVTIASPIAGGALSTHHGDE